MSELIVRSISKRSCEAAHALGVTLRMLPRGRAPARPTAIDPDALPRVPATLLLGPSGSGKTTLLRAIAARARAEGVPVVTLGFEERPAECARRPLVDLFQGSTDDAMRVLARAGLAEAACFVRTADEASTGQRERLRLALALDAARRRAARAGSVLLLIDELASTLDDATARAACAGIRRFLSSHVGVRVFAASPRPMALLGPALRPGALVHFDSSGRASVRRLRTAHDPLAGGPALRITIGTRADYDALAPLHYRAKRPATIVRVLVARERSAGDLGGPAGVLTVSMPTLNAPANARAIMWPGLFDGADRRRAARRLNHRTRGVRCLSRVIIDPAYRGLGVATRLVRAYLRRPMTTYTEAYAAMARASTFFDAAGMTRYEPPPVARTARLLDGLQHAGIEPWELAVPGRALERLRRAGPGRLRLIERELHVWASSSRCTARAARSGGTLELLTLASRAAAGAPVAFAFTHGRTPRNPRKLAHAT